MSRLSDDATAPSMRSSDIDRAAKTSASTSGSSRHTEALLAAARVVSARTTAADSAPESPSQVATSNDAASTAAATSSATFAVSDTAAATAAAPADYVAVLRFMCSIAGLAPATTIGFEFTGAHYCRVFSVICPAGGNQLPMEDVCWNPEPIAVQEHDNVSLFIRACESLDLADFPANLTPVMLRPAVENWSTHMLVQSSLHRLAVTNCVDLTNARALSASAYQPPEEPRCDSGVMQVAAMWKELTSRPQKKAPAPKTSQGDSQSSASQQQPSQTAPSSARGRGVGAPRLATARSARQAPTPSVGAKGMRGGRGGAAPTPAPAQPPAQPVVDPFAVLPAPPFDEPVDLPIEHQLTDYLDAPELAHHGKTHLLMQRQLKEYRTALRRTKHAFLNMLAAAPAPDGSDVPDINWDELVAAAYIRPDLAVQMQPEQTSSSDAAEAVPAA